jgi:hypothetical protein
MAKTASTSTTQPTAGIASSTELCGPLAWRHIARLRRGREADPQEGRRQNQDRGQGKLKTLHSELDAGVRTAQDYTVDKAVADWLAEGLPDSTAKTGEVNEDALRPVLAVIATIALRDLSAHDVRTVSCFQAAG